MDIGNWTLYIGRRILDIGYWMKLAGKVERSIESISLVTVANEEKRARAARGKLVVSKTGAACNTNRKTRQGGGVD